MCAWGAVAVVGLCGGCFEYSPHQILPSESHLNADSIARIVASEAPEPLRIAVIGDTQHHSDETRDAVSSINERDGIAFVVQIGDLTNYGLLDEYRVMERELSRLRVPHLVIIGNHEYLGNGELIYQRMFGPENDAFTLAQTRFVLLDDNSREVNMDGSRPELGWLASALAPGPDFVAAAVFAHVPPDNGDFDPDLCDEYARAVSSAGVRVSVHGHEHSFRMGELFGDGVTYVVVDTVANRSYVVLTRDPEGAFAVEHVSF